MEVVQILVATAVLLTALAGLVAMFRYKPGQRERVEMDRDKADADVGLVNLNIAKGTIELVTETLEAQIKRMSKDWEVLRKEFDQYRLDADSRMAELNTQLRAAMAEKKSVEWENERLKTQLAASHSENHALEARVTELESEVKRLKTLTTGP